MLASWQVAFCTSLREWKARQNPERLRGHCTEAEFEETCASIVSEPVVECMVHLAWVLYYRHMPQCGEPAPERVEERLVSAHRLWCSIQALHRASPAGTFFALPLALLSLRFSVERLFKNTFPVWFDTADGVGTLEAMGLSISAVCDPAGYLACLPALSSGRSALHVLQSKRHQRDTHQPTSFHASVRAARPAPGVPRQARRRNPSSARGVPDSARLLSAFPPPDCRTRPRSCAWASACPSAPGRAACWSARRPSWRRRRWRRGCTGRSCRRRRGASRGRTGRCAFVGGHPLCRPGIIFHDVLNALIDHRWLALRCDDCCGRRAAAGAHQAPSGRGRERAGDSEAEGRSEQYQLGRPGQSGLDDAAT